GRFTSLVIATPVVVVDHSFKGREASVVHIGRMQGHIAQARRFESATIAFLLGYRKAALLVNAHRRVLKFVVGEVRTVVATRATRLGYEQDQTVLLMQSERGFVARRIAIESRVGG